MGHHTDFEGYVGVSPPLNAAEVAYLTAFNDSRRWDRVTGPYATDDPGYYARGNNDRRHKPAPDQPGLWCPWKPTPDGTALVWDGCENPYAAVEWMRYIINHFLRPEAIVQQYTTSTADIPALDVPYGWVMAPEFARFTFDHACVGGFHAQGVQAKDAWTLLVRDNKVTHATAHKPLLPDTGKATPAAATWTEIEARAAAREQVLAPARQAMDVLRYDYPEMDPQQMLDVVLSALISAGYTVTAPDGKTQVESPS